MTDLNGSLVSVARIRTLNVSCDFSVPACETNGSAVCGGDDDVRTVKVVSGAGGGNSLACAHVPELTGVPALVAAQGKETQKQRKTRKGLKKWPKKAELQPKPDTWYSRTEAKTIIIKPADRSAENSHVEAGNGAPLPAGAVDWWSDSDDVSWQSDWSVNYDPVKEAMLMKADAE